MTPSERTRQWRLDNPEKYRALKDRENAARRRRRKEDPEKYRSVARAYYNSERGQQVRQAWNKSPNGQRHLRIQTVGRYGLTPEQYDELNAKQNGVCAICFQPETLKHRNGKTKNLYVDHCHATGRVRGLLCYKCNTGIGLFKDSSEALRRAADYLLS